MRADKGIVRAWEEHIKRFFESAKSMDQKIPWTSQTLRNWVQKNLRETGFAQAHVRMSAVLKPGQNLLMLMMRPFSGYPARYYDKGVQVTVSRVVRGTPRAFNSRIKSNQYLSAIMALQDKRAGRFFETLFMNSEGYLTEGRISNLMIIKKGRLTTPPGWSGILKGVTRRFVLDSAEKLRYPCVEAPITRHDLFNADEAFLTMTSSEVMPVVRCDGRLIGTGVPGPITRQIHRSFQLNIK